MQAMDVMTANVITVRRDTSVREIAQLLLKHQISAVPVVDSKDALVGIVSEGDLMKRSENATEGHRSWWLQIVLSARDKSADYIKSHGRTAEEVMTRRVIMVSEQTPLRDIAGVLEKNRIKRVPVVSKGKLVGIVSRANLLHGLATASEGSTAPVAADDRSIRAEIVKSLADDAGLDAAMINVTVENGVVQLWGAVGSDAEESAARIAAENATGVRSVDVHLGRLPQYYMGY